MKFLYIEGLISVMKFSDDSVDTISEISDFLQVDEFKVVFKKQNKPFIVIGDKIANVGDYLVKCERDNIDVWSPEVFEDFIKVCDFNFYLRNRIL